MMKRALLVAVVLAASLAMAAPALAFNGYRSTYTTSDFCAVCHQSGLGGAPAVYNAWSQTAHANAGADGQALRLPYGSSCAGCHTSNYDPSKVVPTPTATSSTGAVSWAATMPSTFPTLQPQALGDAPMSENFVGCSACHYGATTGATAYFGNDPNDTAHNSPYGNLANAEICGQCHSRFSYTVNTVSVSPVPYTNVTTPLPGTPITPNPSPTTVIQPQYAIGYPMLGTPGSGAGSTWQDAPALTTYLNIPAPGWSPTPDPAATTAAGLQMYWKDAQGNDLPWQVQGHEGSAAQYPDWAISVHANALVNLKAAVGPDPPASCLKCHSADYMIAVAAGKTPPTGAQAKYGVTCVACHTPHNKGTAVGYWDKSLDTQLVTDNAKTLCIQCHTAQIPTDTAASPGATLHETTKEMMAGYGAIGVPDMPSIHAGKDGLSNCVACHMVPTSYGYPNNSVQLGGNHTMDIVMPDVAASATATLGGQTLTMPYSSCSQCHGTPDDPLATHMQDVLDNLQSFMHSHIDAVNTQLGTDAVNMGYANVSAAVTALTAIPAGQRTVGETNFLDAYTNMTFCDSEGSYGIHNPQYAVAVIDEALTQAQAGNMYVPGTPTISAPSSKVYGNTFTISGTVDTSAVPSGAPAFEGTPVWLMTGTSTVVAKSTIGAGNSYSFTVTATKSQKYWVQTQASGDWASAKSTEVTVNVKWRARMTVNHKSVKKGATIKFSGVLLPKYKVKVKLQRYKQGKWVTVKTMSVGYNTWSKSLKMSAKGKFSYRWWVPAAHGYTANKSNTMKVTVK